MRNGYPAFLHICNKKLKIIRGYVGIHTTSFKDFLLREELRKSIASSGFEHPSEGKINKTYLILINFSTTTMSSKVSNGNRCSLSG